MANFFLDNEDLQFHFQNLGLGEVIRLKEDDFVEAGAYPYAPKDEADAMDSYRRVLTMVGELAAEYIAPRAPEVDKEGSKLEGGRVRYARGIEESMEMLRRAELMGPTLPRRFGGLNFPATVYNMALEMISRADASLMNIVGLQDIAVTIEKFADERTKEEYLPRFCAGEVTGAMVLTEPEAGSDLQAVQLKATEDPEAGCWRMNGVKRFITNGCGDVLLVLARSEEGTRGAKGLSLFLYERDDTLKIRRLEDKLGIRGSPTCELQFRDSPARLIGKRRFGLIRYVMSLMSGARLGVAVQALGIAEAAYHEALKYAREREQFGKKIIEFPAVYDMLSTMRMEIELTRSLILATSKAVDMEEGLERRVGGGDVSLKERHKHYSRLASALTPISKYCASEMANRVTTTAIQVHGGPGYMRDFSVERHFRDARITNIYEGTSQLQVVAAVGPVLTGVMSEEFSRLSQGPWGELGGLAERLSVCCELYEGALALVREKRDSEYTDYHARRLVDTAAEIYMGYLLLGEARLSARKALLAKKYISDLLPRIRMNAEQVSSGDRSVIDRRHEILGADNRDRTG